jgi:cytochrome c-type biogenesis protein CcmE
MRAATILVLLLVVAGLSMAIYAFVRSSTPYVTIAEAKERPGNSVQIAAKLVPGSIVSDLTNREVQFTIRDDKTGDQLRVTYSGFKPQDMEEAPCIVVRGSMRDGQFACREILLKCPSKYESQFDGGGA